MLRLEAVTESGLSRPAIGRRIARGRWDHLGRAVYGIVGAPHTWRRQLLVAVWSAGEHAVASHRSAGALWALDGLAEGPIEIAVPNSTVRKVSSARLRRVTPLVARDRTSVDEIPVTSIERTIVDLAGALPMGGLARGLDSALVQGLTRVERVMACLLRVGRRGRKGSRILAALLDERLNGIRPTESSLEQRLERVLTRAGLPRPVRQHKVFDGQGCIGRIDFAYPRARLAIEADSYRWHAAREAWQRDLRRRTRLAAVGWRVVHCTWHELVHQPDQIVSATRSALTDV